MAKIEGITVKVVDNTYKYNPLKVPTHDAINTYQGYVKLSAIHLTEEINKVNPDMDEIIYHAKRLKACQKKIEKSARRLVAIEEIQRVLLEDMEKGVFYTLSQLVDHVFKVYQLYVSETTHRYSAEPTPNRPTHAVKYVLEELENQGIIGHILTEAVIIKENQKPYKRKTTGVRRVYFLK